MAHFNLFNLFVAVALAVLCDFTFTPVSALSVHSSHGDIVARHVAHAHNSVTRRRRSAAGRCKTRSSSLASTSTTSSAASSHTSAKSSSSGSGGKKGGSSSGSSGSGSSSDSGGGGYWGPKVGIAWPNGEDDSLQFYKTSKTKLLYTWGPDCPDVAQKYGFDCVPMLWGDKQISRFQQIVKPGYANYVLGFNEPDQVGQSNMSPQHAADVWKQYINPLKNHGYQLISPACTSAPASKTWMKQFFDACDGCHFDALAMHWYDVGAQKFIDYVEDFYNTFKLPIWVTEFDCQNFNGGAQCSKQDVIDFMSQVQGWMDKTWYVQAYFAFGVMHDMQGVNSLDQLMGSDGKPTQLGYQYINS